MTVHLFHTIPFVTAPTRCSEGHVPLLPSGPSTALVPLHRVHNFPLPLHSLTFTQQLLFYTQLIVVP
jgi:hypothetical protein